MTRSTTHKFVMTRQFVTLVPPFVILFSPCPTDCVIYILHRRLDKRCSWARQLDALFSLFAGHGGRWYSLALYYRRLGCLFITREVRGLPFYATTYDWCHGLSVVELCMPISIEIAQKPKSRPEVLSRVSSIYIHIHFYMSMFLFYQFSNDIIFITMHIILIVCIVIIIVQICVTLFLT